ncbi:MAG: epoxide hydrolase [Alphaproteobacteria bacterium]|nr:epoxide hydrolase [Alphaproteobacteria bacterium]
MAPEAFKIEISQSTISKIMERVRAFEWPDAPEGGGWAYGTELSTMKELVEYWLHSYDWYREQEAMNRLPHFKARVRDLDIHFIHLRSNAPKRRPLIITHGWPGSFVEFMNVMEPLAYPEKHAGSAKDAFDVIIPSLPGYGFSGKPDKPISPRTVAGYFDELMTKNLGYSNYIAQGGDWGSVVSGWLAYEGKGCRAAHLNMFGWRSPGVTAESAEEKQAEKHAEMLFNLEGAYFRQQSTKPLTLSYALMDSPVGTAAWIIEKFKGWSDLDNGKLESIYTKDQLLTNVMIYLVTRTFGTSTWLYRGLFEDTRGAPVPPKSRIEKPVGIARFPTDLIPFPPRTLVERHMNVSRWTEFKRGGHFAAMERPQDFIEDVRAFGSDLDAS